MNLRQTALAALIAPLAAIASPNTSVQLDTSTMASRAPSEADRQWLKQQEDFAQRLRETPHPELEQWLKKQVQDNPLDAGNRRYLESLVQQQQRTGEKTAAGALYFVSFSIPETGLKRMLQEAGRYAIPVTLRGLVNNDMKQTVDAVSQLVQNGATEGVQIDPTLYSQYGINSVPALVVRCEQGFDVIRGNLRLDLALQKVVEQGTCAGEAQQILQQEGHHG
ncbi:conjugal transfer pilus assembly protein TrbC [Edwardsiella tarda]|nr:type-F conjugative transfer system pilin assembly protein TrbC [Edwardsiella tarda]STE53182.1 conjugal transfer pilus assembly protein TrbC [Edwardsiella tarda]